MLYQFPYETALFTTLFDVLLIGLTFGASRLHKSSYRRTSFIAIFLLFGGWSFVKLLSTSPSPAASTPNDLNFHSDSHIGTFYMAVATEEEYIIFWKETINDEDGTLTIEMEGTYPDKLRILKKVDGEYKELLPDLTVSGSNYVPVGVDISDSEFIELSYPGRKALDQVWKRNFMNYISSLVSIMFIILFVWMGLKKASNKM